MKCQAFTGMCIACKPEFEIDAAVISSDSCCRKGTFYNVFDCELCSLDCEDCNSEIWCMTCSSEISLNFTIDNSVACCPQNTYFDTFECASCSSNCLECEKTSQKCLNCYSEVAIETTIYHLLTFVVIPLAIITVTYASPAKQTV